MDTPPPQILEWDGDQLDDSFEEETIFERIDGLKEMFPDSLRHAVGTTFDTSTSCLKNAFNATRKVTWFIFATASILILPISLETERQEYESQVKRQERDILLGSNEPPKI